MKKLYLSVGFIVALSASSLIAMDGSNDSEREQALNDALTARYNVNKQSWQQIMVDQFYESGGLVGLLACVTDQNTDWLSQIAFAFSNGDEKAWKTIINVPQK